MFNAGDRVVHWDSEWYEYETVTAVTELAPYLHWIETSEGNEDFSDNFQLFEPGGADARS